MKEYIDNYIGTPIVSLGVTFVTLFLGAIIGFRLNLWRDKRKEFNRAADIFDAILVSNNPISDSDFNVFARYLGRFKRKGFWNTVQQYKDAAKVCRKPSSSEISGFYDDYINNPARAAELRQNLRKFAKRKQ